MHTHQIKKYFCALLLVSASTLSAQGLADEIALVPRDSARVFISGHSLTWDPLGETVLSLAKSLGKDFNFNEQLVSGSPIRVRTFGPDWNAKDWQGYKLGKNREGENLDVINELKTPKTLGKGEKYDTLVITERHDLLGTIMWEDTIGLLRHYNDRLIDGNPNAHTFFYQSWLDIDKKDPSIWIDHTKKDRHAWECVASKVNLTLNSEGRKDYIETLPTGAALVELVEKVIKNEVKGITGTTEEKLNILFQDNVHMTAAGSYFVSLVTYSAVFRSPSMGGEVPAGINTDTAKDLQNIAWNYIKQYYTTPDAGKHSMEECRAYIASTVCPSFWLEQKKPNKTSECQANFSDPNAEENPFRWPDPKLKLYPKP